MATTLDATLLSPEELAQAVVFGKPLINVQVALAFMNKKDRAKYERSIAAAQYIKSLELKAQALEKLKKK